MRVLTGAEVRFAAEHKIPVHYIETYEDPGDQHLNFNGECILAPAEVGYYIGTSDIDPDDYGDRDLVEGDFPEGTFKVCAARGQRYKERDPYP